ncbi:MAG: hypothetical protein U0L59_07285 [Faecalimonas sp.]|nr:hypothetical protein [Faecalimonas sp.]
MKLSVGYHEAERERRTDEASLMLIGAVKTRELCGRWDKSIRNLLTVWMAVGVEVTGA